MYPGHLKSLSRRLFLILSTVSAVKDALMEKYALEQSDITEENISGTISGEMRTNAILSVIIAGIFIMIYIWVDSEISSLVQVRSSHCSMMYWSFLLFTQLQESL